MKILKENKVNKRINTLTTGSLIIIGVVLLAIIFSPALVVGLGVLYGGYHLYKK